MDEHSHKIFGLKVWVVLVGLGAAGVAGYLLFFRKPASSDGGATTFSSQGLAVMQNPDESATMALQNQELTTIANQLDQGLAALNNQGTVLQTQVSGIGDQIGQVSGQVAGEQAAISGGFTQLGGQLGQIQSTQASQGAADNAYYNSLLQNLVQYANALSAQNSALSQQSGAQYNMLWNQNQTLQDMTHTQQSWGTQSVSDQIQQIQRYLGMHP